MKIKIVEIIYLTFSEIVCVFWKHTSSEIEENIKHEMFPHASVCLEAEKPVLSFAHSHTNSTCQCILCHKHKLQKNRLHSLCRVHFFY